MVFRTGERGLPFFLLQGGTGFDFCFRHARLAWGRSGLSLRDFANWWQGTLNEATGEEFVIRGEGEYLVFINMPTVS